MPARAGCSSTSSMFGTDFQICRLMWKGPGVPKSKLCAQAFMEAWVSWAGWPKDVRVDRGLRNRSYFARVLGAHGICPFNAGLESPEHIGKVGRKGGMWKKCAKRSIHAEKLEGEGDMRMLAFGLNGIINDRVRKSVSCAEPVGIR